jgi:tetratricopeptide (TPR) repeat protein
MLRLLITFILIWAILASPAQSAPEKANTCFDKKDYQCAVDNYLVSLESALGFDSLQKEALLLWPRVLIADNYTLNAKRPKCISVLNRAIKIYASENKLVSNLYNCKAVITESTDTASIRLSLETAVKICPENIDPWDNLLKYYGSYNNAKGAVMADKLIDILKKKKDNVSVAAACIYKGDFLWRLDKKEDAKKAWQEALVWDAANATAKERIKM